MSDETTVIRPPQLLLYEREAGIAFCGICRAWSRLASEGFPVCGKCGTCGSDSLGTKSIVGSIASWNRG